MMKTTQRFYCKYFGLCCEWYFSESGMEREADFAFALFPYLMNGVKDNFRDAEFRNMASDMLGEIEQTAGERCQPIGEIGYYYPAWVWISEHGKL